MAFSIQHGRYPEMHASHTTEHLRERSAQAEVGRSDSMIGKYNEGMYVDFAPTYLGAPRVTLSYTLLPPSICSHLSIYMNTYYLDTCACPNQAVHVTDHSRNLLPFKSSPTSTSMDSTGP